MLTIAKTFAEKAKGFMGVDRIADDEAILFVGVGSRAGFHMNTVGCDVTLASLDEDLKVIEIALMKARVGQHSTAPGARHALEGNADLMSKLSIGSEPDWSMFGASKPEIREKRSSRKAQIDLVAEMTKEIMRMRFNGEDDVPMSVTYVSEVVGPEFKVQEMIGTDISLAPADAEADRKYYGSDTVGPKKNARSVLCEVLDSVLGRGAARFDGRLLLISAKALEGFKWTIRAETSSGRRVISARKIDDKGKAIAVLCVLDGAQDVIKKACGNTEEDYIEALSQMTSDVA